MGDPKRLKESVPPDEAESTGENTSSGTFAVHSGRRWQFRRVWMPAVHYLPIGPEIKVLPSPTWYVNLRRRISASSRQVSLCG